MSVFRIYTERKDKQNFEVMSLLEEIKSIHGNENILGTGDELRLRILNRYDIEGVNNEMLETCKREIFAEPFTDEILTSLPDDFESGKILAVEFLPGQYDQRADAAELRHAFIRVQTSH